MIKKCLFCKNKYSTKSNNQLFCSKEHREKKNRIINKDKIREYARNHYYRNREYILSLSKEYGMKNYAKRKKYYSEWRKRNSYKIKEYYRKYYLINKLKFSLRHRVFKFLKSKNVKKTKNTELILGADYVFVKNYIESKFKKGMTWDNHGFNGWHIDHIIPLASAKTEDEMYKLCHYTNLQPLWAKENFSKHARIL